MQLMENTGGSSFSEPLAKAGDLLVRILTWYQMTLRERRAKPITVSMDDFSSILNPFFNKWVSISYDGEQFCGQFDGFDVAASTFPRLLLYFKNVAYTIGGHKEEYMDKTATIGMAPRNNKVSYLVVLPARVINSSSSNIIVEKDGSSNTDLIVSDQANFKFMEELGANPSINAGLRFLRDLVVGEGGSEVSVLHPIQILGFKTVFPRGKSDIVLDALEEYIERGDLIVG